MSESIILGSRIDRFEVEAEVGRGGMGLVYRCYDPQYERQVALKMMAAHLTGSAEALARFQREAALVGSFKHPHIAIFHEFGEMASRPYLVMEWVDGRTLKEELAAHHKLTQARCLALFAQLAKAIDYAHAHGVIHRDLKPANIIIGPDDAVTIVDFGVALLDTAPSLTATGLIVGTPLYMSPEQIKGHELDGRSDQYSLAIILYEMLTGQFPYESIHVPAIYHQQLLGEPIPITERDPTIPISIERALQKALAKEPADRFDTIGELNKALTRPTAVPLERRPNHFLPAVPRWQHQAEVAITTTVQINHQWLLLGQADGVLKLLTLDSAEVCWQVKVDGRVTGLVHDNDHIYASMDSGSVQAWQIVDGAEQWRQQNQPGRLFLINEETLLLVLDQGVVCSLNPADGQEMKRMPVTAGDGEIINSFILDDQLYLVYEQSVVAYGPPSDEQIGYDE